MAEEALPAGGSPSPALLLPPLPRPVAWLVLQALGLQRLGCSEGLGIEQGRGAVKGALECQMLWVPRAGMEVECPPPCLSPGPVSWVQQGCGVDAAPLSSTSQVPPAPPARWGKQLEYRSLAPGAIRREELG